jgi:hypothetical protein
MCFCFWLRYNISKKWWCYFCGAISSAQCCLLLQMLDDVDIEEGKRDLITREIGKFREIMKVMTTSFTPYRVVDDVGHLNIVTVLISCKSSFFGWSDSTQRFDLQLDIYQVNVTQCLDE